MRVVFLQDVPNVARAGDIKEVADGYGKNFLIARKLAVPASPGVASQLKAQQRAEAKRQARTDAELVKLAGELNGKEVTLKAKVGAKDRLYGSITSADIAAELETSAGVVVNKRKIELDKPIRGLGSYEVAIRLAKDIVPKIKVTIIEKEPD